METIEMSTRERKRMTLMTRVVEGLLKLREAAEMMRSRVRVREALELELSASQGGGQLLKNELT